MFRKNSYITKFESFFYGLLIKIRTKNIYYFNTVPGRMQFSLIMNFAKTFLKKIYLALFLQ